MIMFFREALRVVTLPSLTIVLPVFMLQWASPVSKPAVVHNS